LILLEVTGLQSDVNATLNVNLYHSDMRYSTPPDAKQAYGTFATNDARISGAFYENDQIQYVLCTLDTTTGFPAVYHGVVSNVSGTPTVHGYIIGDNILGFGYPNIAYSGTSSTDNSAIIGFDHSATSVYAGISTIAYDGANYSPIVQVKAGSTYINAIAQKQERWGDYFGAQTRFNQPGTVWIAGTFGIFQTYGTWIAELNLTSNVGIGEHPQTTEHLLYPNPVIDMMKVNFKMSSDSYLYFEIYSVDGKLVQSIYEARAHSGDNEFQFSAASLPRGVYYLRIRDNKETVLNQKIEKL
jgi:hypothetical protein